MSVVPMKMLTVAGPAGAIDDVICTCLINQQFHPVETSAVAGKSMKLTPLAWSNPWQDLLSTAQKLLEEMDLPFTFQDFRQQQLTRETAAGWLETISQQKAMLDQKEHLLTNQIRENTQAAQDLQRFAGLPSNLTDIYHLGYVRFRFGRMLREAFDSLNVKLGEKDEIILYPTDHVSGTPEDSARLLKGDTQSCQEALSRLHEEYESWKHDNTIQLQSIYSYLRFMYAAGEIKKYAALAEDQTFLLCGWIPSKELPKLHEAFGAFPDVMLAEDDPGMVKSETPPVKLKNNFWARLFQPFTEMYGLPAYNEFDPTFLMAITYSILFGIMYGDVGQGLVLIALGVFLYKKKGMWLGGILGSVGVFSTIFGFVFGSFFGYEHLIPGFHVLESGANATRILLVSAAIGVVTITAMMLINIVNGIRQKDIKKIFFTNNSVAGIIFYLAVVIGAVVMLTTGAKVFTPVYIIVFIVLPVLVMFCQEPLGKLAAHKKDWKPESIGGFIAENFFEMFEVILSYVTNTVSFLRVGAYAICHAGMMLVVYTLAGDPASPVVLVIGNILVMGIEGLMVCIQVLRLEFYEMFGRFYESGSREFTPALVDYTKKIELS